MDFFLDSAELDEISRFQELGVIDGVTTNPSLIYKSKKPFRELVADICETMKGPVAWRQYLVHTINWSKKV